MLDFASLSAEFSRTLNCTEATANLAVKVRTASASGEFFARGKAASAVLESQKRVDIAHNYRQAFLYIYCQYEGYCRAAFRMCFQESWRRSHNTASQSTWKPFVAAINGVFKKPDAPRFTMKGLTPGLSRTDALLYHQSSNSVPNPDWFLTGYQNFSAGDITELFLVGGFRLDWDAFDSSKYARDKLGLRGRDLGNYLQSSIDNSTKTRNIIAHEGGGEIPGTSALLEEILDWATVFSEALQSALVPIAR